MKSKMMAWLLAPALLLQVSCSESQEEKMDNMADSTVSNVEAAVDNVQEDVQDYRDEVFVSNVYKENKEELLLIDLALTKATDAKIKTAAKNMQADHRKLDETLAAYAAKNNIDLTKETVVNDNLETQEAGADWDQEWERKMTNAHEKVVNKFERKQKNANSEELKQIVDNTLPVLNKHMEMVKSL